MPGNTATAVMDTGMDMAIMGGVFGLILND